MTTMSCKEDAYPGFILLNLTHHNLSKVSQQAAALSIELALLLVDDAPAGNPKMYPIT